MKFHRTRAWSTFLASESDPTVSEGSTVGDVSARNPLLAFAVKNKIAATQCRGCLNFKPSVSADTYFRRFGLRGARLRLTPEKQLMYCTGCCQYLPRTGAHWIYASGPTKCIFHSLARD
jgi:hypothetical protein